VFAAFMLWQVLADNPSYEGPPVDVWSCGVILFVCLTGDLPFSDRDTEMLFKKIKNAEIKPPKGISPDALDLLTRMLQADPVKRISIEQIKLHPWFILPTPTDLPIYASNALQRQQSRIHGLRDTQDDIREVEEVDDNDKFTAYRGQTMYALLFFGLLLIPCTNSVSFFLFFLFLNFNSAQTPLS
jgi:serine/threonine protein kinase